MSTLERAICIAAEAHSGQTDKAGAPYILHPLRVMLRMRDQDERIVAVLHDVVEDSSWTIDALRKEGFSKVVVEALEYLTRKSDESYEEFIQRVSGSDLSRRVKLADLDDNSDMTRFAAPTTEDYRRLEKYRKAKIILSMP